MYASPVFGESATEAEAAALRLKQIGAIIESPDVGRYLEGLTLRLFPELQGALRIEVVAHPSANAFSLGGEGIYVHSGLFLRVHNEAELAAILAHEGAHLWHQHAPKNAKEARRNEIEADRTARERLRATGIPIGPGADLFQRLLLERKTLGFSRREAVSTHPALDDRFRRWAEATDADEPHWEDPSGWSQRLSSVRELGLQQLLNRQDYARVVFLLDDENLRMIGSARDLALAYALQIRNLSDDRVRAEAIYARLIQREQAPPEAFSGQARLFMRSGRLREARTAFGIYLERSNDPRGRRWAEHYLAWLELQTAS
ncbi:MAG: M48 family metallopeptidase [Pseudomonadota bacterium]